MMFNSPFRLAAYAGLVGALGNTLRLELVSFAVCPPAVAAFLGALVAGLLASLMMPRRDPVKEMMGARLYAHPDRGGRGDGTGGDGTVSTDGKKMMFVVPEDLRTALRLRKAKTDKDMGKHTDDSMVDLIQQLHERVRAAHQDWDDGEIAASYGIGLGTYLRFCGAKAALDELESHHAEGEERLTRACVAAMAEDPSVAPVGVAGLTGASLPEVMRVWERARNQADDEDGQALAPVKEDRIDPLFLDEQIGQDDR